MSIVHIRFPITPPGDLLRAPQLEALLTHATAAPSPGDWRREAFRNIAGPHVPMPSVASVAAATSCAAPARPASVDVGAAMRAHEPAYAWVFVATPLHCVAGMSSITLSADGLLNLDEAAAEVLASDFNRVFSGSGMRLVLGAAGLLLCEFERPVEASSSDPERAVGRDLFDFQPTGADAPQLRAAMSEFEMWLYDHAVNRARVARDLPPVTGLWLWGGGPIRPALPPVVGWTAGRDPLFAAFGDLAAYPAARAAQASRPGVVVCAVGPGCRAWADVESRWLAPAAAALRTGALKLLQLSAGVQRFEVAGGRHWRFWRRARPWWETLQAEGSE